MIAGRYTYSVQKQERDMRVVRLIVLGLVVSANAYAWKVIPKQGAMYDESKGSTGTEMGIKLGRDCSEHIIEVILYELSLGTKEPSSSTARSLGIELPTFKGKLHVRVDGRKLGELSARSVHLSVDRTATLIVFRGNDAWIDQFKKGNAVELGMKTTDGFKYIPFSLIGFTKAYEELYSLCRKE